MHWTIKNVERYILFSVSKINSILSIIVRAVYWAMCIQLISLLMIVRIHILYLFIINKSEVCTICHCLRPGHGQWYVLYVFRYSYIHIYIYILECGTWYHHPRRLQCVLSRNLRIFKVATWHYRCRHNLKINSIWDNLQCYLLVPRSPSKPVMLTFDLQSRKV